MQIDGRCHCGAIGYTAKVDPETVVLCNCTDCQTFSGAPYRVSVRVRLEDFRLTGEPSTYLKIADSGREVTTTFCGRCGTSLYSHGEGRDFIYLRVGSVRQRAELPPRRQGFRHSAQTWAQNIVDVPVRES